MTKQHRRVDSLRCMQVWEVGRHDLAKQTADSSSWTPDTAAAHTWTHRRTSHWTQRYRHWCHISTRHQVRKQSLPSLDTIVSLREARFWAVSFSSGLSAAHLLLRNSLLKCWRLRQNFRRRFACWSVENSTSTWILLRLRPQSSANSRPRHYSRTRTPASKFFFFSYRNK